MNNSVHALPSSMHTAPVCVRFASKLLSANPWICFRDGLPYRLGLLAGLHEFPTAVNVSVASPPANTKIAGTLLSALLTAPPASSSPSSSSRSRLVSKGEIEIDSEEEHELASEQDTGLRIQATRRPQLETKPTPVGPTAATTCPSAVCVVKIVPAGDVLHIFSHIRKTYRVQWVVLEGGSADGPPPLVQQPASCLSPDPGPAIPKTTKGKGVKGKSKTPSRKHRQPAISPSPSPTQQPQRNISDSNTIGNNGEAVPNSHRPPGAQWVMLDAVADAKYVLSPSLLFRRRRSPLCAFASAHRSIPRTPSFGFPFFPYPPSRIFGVLLADRFS